MTYSASRLSDGLAVLEPYAKDFLAEAGVNLDAATGPSAVKVGGGRSDWMFGSRSGEFMFGLGGNDKMFGGRGADKMFGGDGRDWMFGNRGDDAMLGGDGNDYMRGGSGNDSMEGGAGNDRLSGGRGEDHLLAFSWGGEQAPAQGGAQYNENEPISDRDILTGGADADIFEFRWLIDAKATILDKHRDENGVVDYSGNGVAGENNNVHDHWVETTGTKIVRDFDAAEGDTLIFEGHTLTLDSVEHYNFDRDRRGTTDTVLNFISDQGANGGAHDQDDLGRVVLLGVEMDAADFTVNAGVNYGTEDPYFGIA